MGPLELLVPSPSQLTTEEEEEVGDVALLAGITFISLSYTEREQHAHAYCTQVTHNQTANIISFYSYSGKTVSVRECP